MHCIEYANTHKWIVFCYIILILTFVHRIGEFNFCLSIPNHFHSDEEIKSIKFLNPSRAAAAAAAADAIDMHQFNFCHATVFAYPIRRLDTLASYPKDMRSMLSSAHTLRLVFTHTHRRF